MHQALPDPAYRVGVRPPVRGVRGVVGGHREQRCGAGDTHGLRLSARLFSSMRGSGM